MKWKNKKGKLRAIGPSGRNYQVVKDDDTFILKVEESPGRWEDKGVFDSADKAKAFAQDVDNLFQATDIRDELVRQERMEKIEKRDRIRRDIEGELPDIVKLAKLYSKAHSLERAQMRAVLDLRGMGEARKLVEDLVESKIY